MPLTEDRLREIVVELLSRPGHEKVRALCYSLLVDGLGASSTELFFERQLPEVRGRADALLGRTVLELKSDLRREERDAEEELHRYMRGRERETSDRFVGIATDGATFLGYEIDRAGKLRKLATFSPRANEPRGLLRWLGAAVAVRADLTPDLETIRIELGRDSLAYQIAGERLERMWSDVKESNEAVLKRELWTKQLEWVYGTAIESDRLFLQHTYLTIVTKAMAVLAMGVDLPAPADLLSGRPFSDAGIEGAVESDFFNWVLQAKGSTELIGRICRQVARFRLRDIEDDVLKVLYESLIDPEQRHDLGEYYTPDWLAQKMCEHTIERPLEQRVLDPACGSGTFLFHAIRRLLAAADAAGMSNKKAVQLCCDRVIGIDVHPVAVLIARVTYLLALGEERLRKHPAISIPVYLGDSMQWNTEQFLAEREVLIDVPNGPMLEFPWVVAKDPGLFDSVIQRMLDMSKRCAKTETFEQWLKREHGLGSKDVSILAGTYGTLRKLREAGRNHIWGYVARNLSRPVWLSSDEEKSDVVIGNPPWLSYRYMSSGMAERFRKECRDRDLWAGGHVATQQDLSAYFFAKSVELYLQPRGRIAFLMPYAALNRKQFEGFRRGWFGGSSRGAGKVYATVRFLEAWTFDSQCSQCRHARLLRCAMRPRRFRRR